MARQIRVAPELHVDAEGLRALSRDIKAAGPSFRTLWRKRLAEAGQVVADAARANADTHSTRIGATTKVSVTASAVSVTQGGARAPGAAAIENKGKPGQFRHPVFNRGGWAEQEAHPSLVPAADNNADRVAEVLADVMEDYARKAGFK